MTLPLFFPARWLAWLAPLGVALAAPAAAQPAVQTTEHVRAELLAHAPAGVAPGKTVWLALAIQHQPHWHTYWKNPGDSGLPTTLNWQLNDGAVAGDIAWPTPQALRAGPLINYGYEGTVLLPVPLTIPAGFDARELQVTLQAEWLACEDICVPESGEFALKIPARSATVAHAKAFEDALSRVPQEPASARARAVIERRALKVEVDGLPTVLRGRELQVTLQAEWLACKDICVPESGEFALKIPARSATVAHAKAFEDALSRVPQAPSSVQARAVIERRALKVEVDGLPTALRGRELRLFVELPGVVEHAATIEQRWDAARWVARVPLSSQRSERPATMHGVLVPAGEATGIRVLLTITGSWATASSPAAVPAAHTTVVGSTDNAAESGPSSIKE